MKHKKKRFMAGFLAIVLFCLTFIPYIPTMKAHAATFSGKNLWTGGSEIMFGKSRNYLYRWSDGWQDTFCINPKFHMGSDVYAGAVRYNIEDPNIPYIESKEDFERLALICDWYEKKGSIMSPNAQYVAAQGAIWAIVEGEWENVDSIMSIINRHVSGGVLNYWQDLKNYISTAYTGANGLPPWCSTTETGAITQNMTMKNGKYQIDLDFSQKPDIAYVQWNLKDGWSKTISGTTLTLTYSGSMNPPIETIQGQVPNSMASIVKNSQNLTIYLPYRDRDQPMISAGLNIDNKIYIKIGGASDNEPGTPGDLELYRHSETFNSTYKIDLKKYCAETGKELAGTTFQVLEAFNSSQLGDGTNGTVSKEFMSPSPTTWSGFRVCDEILTDSNGHAEHTDRRSYDYDKTYCGGHPEPDYVEVPDVGEDGSGADEAAAAEEENDRLFEEWQALVEACEDLASDGMHFHSEDEGAAREMMISDRDETYEAFINLQYEYTLKEKTARPGYILHGQHNDDQPIETIITDASEAGGNSSITGRRTILPEKISYTVQEKPLKGMPKTWNGLSILPSLPAPAAAAENQLEDIRIIEGISVSDRPGQLATPLDAQKNTDNQVVATPLDAEKKASPLNAQKKASPLDAEKEHIEEEEIEELEEEDTIWLINDLGLDSPDLPPEEGSLEADTPNGYTLLERTYDVIREKAEFSTKASLPSPTEDDVPPVSSGSSSNLSYTFVVYDHRTEGEFHINKRDWELYQADKDESYGKTQGDATLEGAVYGLYASEDIIHPDGKTGKVFSRNDLVSIATTDKEGNASFLCITEVTLTSSLALNKAGTWIGHPLLLGNYYVKEISRSEGYELSVQGINLTETNRTGSGSTILANAGTASASGLSHPVDEHDGSWNEFTVTNFKTEDGYDVFVNGYPEGSKFYAVERKEETTIESVVIGTETVETGDYQKAEPGERKMDASGNDIPVRDADGNLVYDTSKTESETYFINYRLNVYPKGTATPTVDTTKWADTTSVDAAYVKAEANSMLKQIGYKALDDTHGGGSPWKEIELTGVTNADLITNILDWYALNDFWDSGAVESVYQDGSVWKATIFHDYQTLKNRAIYDAKNGDLYIRKDITVSGGAVEYHGYIPYSNGEFTLNGYYGTATEAKKYLEGIPFKGNMEDYLTLIHPILYETYGEGEYRLDHNGNKIPETETRFIYGDMPQTVINTYITPIDVVYDKEKEQYSFHVDNVTDWATQTESTKSIFRAAAPEKSIVVDGEEMDYADYLVNIKGAGVIAAATPKGINEGSYIQFLNLIYPGQMKVYQDSQTRTKPVIVQQRVIKQAIKVTKDIAQDSYEGVNTYNIHKDPFTVLFGGYLGRPGTKTLKGFFFKLYKKSDIQETGLLESAENGTLDYEKFFNENPEYATTLAVEWDNPKYDADGDLTTVHANQGGGKDDYWGTSIPIPYGTYVLVEQQPTTIPTKHYSIDKPKEITLPFVPEVDSDGTVHDKVPSKEFLYDSQMTPEELVQKYHIRFNEETDIIQAHNHDGDFKVFKYGLDKDIAQDCENETVAAYYHYGSISENSGKTDGVYYETYFDRDGNVIDYGVTLDNVDTMTGISTAVDRVYAPALVPWSILDPRYGEIINDNGDVGNRDTGLDAEGNFNYVAFAAEDMENHFYSSKIRFEKLDSETGENIIHEGALFQIYAAKRDITGVGSTGVAGTGKVLFNPDGTPQYDPAEQIIMKDETGAEIGTFKAYSTVRDGEVTNPDGSVTIEKRCVGYIETYQPLGAGAYVLVEVEAPAGYVKSKPIAFEVYSDKVDYYPDGGNGSSVTADNYQYIKKINPDGSKITEDVHQIEVLDFPTHIKIHKKEAGEETITYQVTGTEEQLKSRGDVILEYLPDGTFAGYGFVTKTYDEFSESIVTGTEEELKNTEGVEPIYNEDGSFSGKGIRYSISVSKATLKLYQALQITKTDEHEYEGIIVNRDENHSVTKIIATKTGTNSDIQDTGNKNENKNPVWDIITNENPSVELYRYDLETDPIETDEETGILYGLDDRGNRVCMLDSTTGMAYTTDNNGNLFVWPLKDGKKILTQSIEIHTDENGKQTIYQEVESVKDENGLPIYYTNGYLTFIDNEWITEEEGHEISRIPFGAYIMEETVVPFDQGYIQTASKGLLVNETTNLQHFYLADDFTKIEISKIDMTTKEEIPDALLTLYEAERIPDTSPRGWHLEIALNEDGTERIYDQWKSGYEYDDNGNLKLDADGNPIPSSKPRWIDHIPIGDYILEETITPYQAGYIKAESIEVFVLETGKVQGAVMEDDHTAIEFLKLDSETGTALSSSTPAKLALYQAELDSAGEPVYVDGIPVYNPDEKILDWVTDDGKLVAATGREEALPDGTAYIKYDYDIKPITGQINAFSYVTETGALRIEYLPIGDYVLVEEKAPDGMVTADPMYIEVKEIGATVQIQSFTMVDYPIQAEITKNNITGGKEIYGAKLAIYKADESGKLRKDYLYDADGNQMYLKDEEDRYVLDESGNRIPLYDYDQSYLYETWTSGTAGRFQTSDLEQGNIPDGYQVGDLKPHLIKFIPAGKYYLVEHTASYGYVKAAEVFFEVEDSREITKVEMVNVLVQGKLVIDKYENKSPEKKLAGAVFRITNTSTGKTYDITTDSKGHAESGYLPIGRINNDGVVTPFVFSVKEIEAPEGYMLDETVYTFSFNYQYDTMKQLIYTLEIPNKKLAGVISKVDITNQKELPGAKLKLVDSGGNTIDEWISTGKAHGLTEKLIPGETYTLIEVQPPDGYTIADPIEFQVKEDGTFEKVTMKDSKTNVTVYKKDIDGNILTGATLQIVDSENNVLEEWVSESVPHEISGQLVLGNTYWLVEKKAPSGYRIAAPIEFIMTQEPIVLTMVDEKKPHIPDGGGEKPSYIAFKKKDLEGNLLPGATFEFYRSDGSFLTKATTRQDGLLEIQKPEVGTYYFWETKTPDGYYPSNKIHSFTINENGVVTGDREIINVPHTKVSLIKADADTGKFLPGAYLQVIAPNGEVVYEGTTGEDGMIHFIAPMTGQYTVKELKAPDNYSLTPLEFQFTVNEDGTTSGTTIIYNHSTMSTKKIGKIIASYEPGVSGRYFVPGLGWGLPKTGDDSNHINQTLKLIGLIALNLSALAAVIILFLHDKKKRAKKLFTGLILIGALSIAGSQNTYAAAAEEQNWSEKTDEVIVINKESVEIQTVEKITETEDGLSILITTPNLEYVPKKLMKHDGITYYLDSVIEHPEVEPEQLNEAVSVKILHENIEDYGNPEDDISKTIEVTVLDEKTNEQFKSILDFQDSFRLNERWKNDFEMVITFQEYDADDFVIGNSLISKEYALEELKQQDYELMESIGLNPEYYLIESIQWVSEEYVENGIWYRQALATGKRFLWDVEVTYGASIPIPSIPVLTLTAAYVPLQELEVSEDSGFDFWDFLKNHPVIMIIAGIAILLLLLLIILILYLMSKKKKGSKKNNDLALYKKDESE